MIALLLLTIAALPVTPYSEVREQVDLIERNHFYDPCGCPVYDQLIFYEYNHAAAKYFVRAWCLIDVAKLTPMAFASHSDATMRVRWYDSSEKLNRLITSLLYRETWTQKDPERSNKLIIDERNRTALRSR